MWRNLALAAMDAENRAAEDIRRREEAKWRSQQRN